MTDKLLHIHTPEGTDYLGLPEPEPNYVTKAPGMPVRFPDGRIVNMNRATRRRNKLYGSHVIRTKAVR